ncbi:MAG: hypothetical protein PHD11_03275 [Bacteroidales bacterium]|nr:hypothetical protein [Bacteroidales bacterium]MDD4669760.1 hypothetical protein [Bacteroidales bacterium]
MKKEKNTNVIKIRSSAAEYLTFVAASGDDKDSVEMRYENENIWLTQNNLSLQPNSLSENIPSKIG